VCANEALVDHVSLARPSGALSEQLNYMPFEYRLPKAEGHPSPFFEAAPKLGGRARGSLKSSATNMPSYAHG
jgi:hypothetical protein